MKNRLLSLLVICLLVTIYIPKKSASAIETSPDNTNEMLKRIVKAKKAKILPAKRRHLSYIVNNANKSFWTPNNTKLITDELVKMAKEFNKKVHKQGIPANSRIERWRHVARYINLLEEALDHPSIYPKQTEKLGAAQKLITPHIEFKIKKPEAPKIAERPIKKPRQPITPVIQKSSKDYIRRYKAAKKNKNLLLKIKSLKEITKNAPSKFWNSRFRRGLRRISYKNDFQKYIQKLAKKIATIKTPQIKKLYLELLSKATKHPHLKRYQKNFTKAKQKIGRLK